MHNRFLKHIFAIILAVILISVCALGVSATENTTYTYTVSVDSEWTRTQFAYTSGGIKLQGIGLSSPRDIFCKENYIFVADEGNSRIVKYDLSNDTYISFGEDVLKKPSGIFVCENGKVYVADPEAQAIFRFDENYNLELSIKRPESTLFSKDTVYRPKNIVLSDDGCLFAVGVGCKEGLMQFDEQGKFYGFFASNKRNLTLEERLQNIFFTDRQKEQLMMRTAKAIENIDISQRNLVCSVTQSADSFSWISASDSGDNMVKLHNMAGKNILSPNDRMNDEWNFADIAAGSDNTVYAVTQTGLVYEYDSQGSLIFSFGGRAVSSDINGLLTNACAIDLDEKGFVYVLDNERALVQFFIPTDFADLTHQAIRLLENGNYEQSEELWQELLNLNGMSRLANMGYGRSLFHQNRFSEAAQYFKRADAKEYYSETFWEIRNEWLSDNILTIIIVAIGIFLIYGIVGRIIKKRRLSSPVSVSHTESAFSLFWKDIFRMFRHPIDVFYDIKHNKTGTVLSASVIYIMLFAVYMAERLFKSYLFGISDLRYAPIWQYALIFVAAVPLWILSNGMVSSINEGEGSFCNLYIATAYSFVPFLVITPFTVLLTYGLSLNEAFIIQLLTVCAYVWSFAYLFLEVVQIHAYTVKEAVKNIILTLFFMLVIIVAIVMLLLIWKKIASFLSQLFGEVRYGFSK